MPRFNENEKIIIKEKLFIEGERLFTLHGIKKVTVDDLVKAAGIAKGSFYAFYQNKEHLYMDILGNQQRKIWEDTQFFLDNNRTLSSYNLTKQVIYLSLFQMQKYPMLTQNNTEVTDYLYRKLPKEVLETHTKDDELELSKLQEYGVTFKCSVGIATKALQSLSLIILRLNDDDDKNAVTEILINGIVNEIVSDDK